MDFHEFRKVVNEMSSATASGAAFVDNKISLRTGKSDTAKRPSVIQPRKKKVTAKSMAYSKPTFYSQGGIT
jgi:hypothetical protein